MATSTRERIIDAAIAMFNAHRYGKVTMMGLAAHLGITKGNLWYHFSEKSSLLDAISQVYLDRVSQRELIDPEPGQSLQSYVRFLQVLTREIQDFRFMYRDQADYGEHSDQLLARLPSIYDRVLQQFANFYRAMAAESHLVLAPQMMDAAALNAVMILRYFLEFSRERQEADAEGPRIVGQAMRQHLTLLDGRLTAQAWDYLCASLTAQSFEQAAA